ncbi:MAG: biotin--[acetyl-CoA-carboxylase] ligase [Bacteroidota bacterium]|nr:biotin--[acetyl-CoA-carboxylase] ligase [Bacteroidota bacterium]
MKESRKIIKLDEVDSTNKYAIKELKENRLNERDVVFTQFQTFGKGYGANVWESKKNKNLLFSIIFKPDFISPSGIFLISKIVSLSIKRFVQKYVKEDVFIKWPNDIYVEDKKIAGILIYNELSSESISFSISGIGLNINQVSFSEALPNPVSLKILTKENHNIDTCLQELIKEIDRFYSIAKNGFIEKIANEYLNSMYLLEKEHIFKDENGNKFNGKIKGISEEGFLLVETKSGTGKYDFKEIVF